MIEEHIWYVVMKAVKLNSFFQVFQEHFLT